MSFIINKELEFSSEEMTEKSLELNITEHINQEVNRYISSIKKTNEIGFIFLKSVIYVEENLKEINGLLHGSGKQVGLNEHIRLIKLIKDEDLEKSVILLERIKNIRDNFAHNLDYEPENDSTFLDLFSIDKNLSQEEKRMKIVMYFKNIIYGILLIKFGIKTFNNFLILKVM